MSMKCVKVQRNLLMACEQDFSKHIHDGQTVQKCGQFGLPFLNQLAKENKKFIYAQLQKGARSKDYEIALQWLKDSGLVHSVPRVEGDHIWATFRFIKITPLNCMV